MNRSPRQYVEDALEAVLIVDPSEMTPGARLRQDLGAVELDIIEIVMALEEDCEVSFGDELDPNDVQTVQNLVDLLTRKVGEHGRTNTQ